MAKGWGGQSWMRHERTRLTQWAAAIIIAAAVTIPAATLIADTANAQSLSQRFLVSVGETTLADGLRALQRSTGAKVVFSPEQLGAFRTKGVNGQFTIEEALKLLLDGSGFEAQATGAGTFVIVDTRAARLFPYSRILHWVDVT
jgi:hypothetical protein